jgi:hypothetical protein
MAAYNWVVFPGTCPVCGEVSSMRAQCHVAASFEGDARGRFCGKKYTLGQPMDWWAREHPFFSQWRDPGAFIPDLDAPEHVEEACNVNCVPCGAQLYAIIAFEVNVPVELNELGLESLWPARYFR